MQFPEDEHGFTMEDQVYLGDTGMLVHPVTKKDAESVDVYIGETEVSCSTVSMLTRLIMTTSIIPNTKERGNTRFLHR
jgi:hypothetical protein